jgi:hypothetical protein
MIDDKPTKNWIEFIDKFTWDMLIKALVFNIGYLFSLTIVGSLIVTVYNYYYPLDMMSEASFLIAASIFTVFVIVDLGLLQYNKPSPALIVLLIVISPLFVIYKLIKDTDFIRIDRSTPQRLKNYIPLRIINT